MIELIAPIASGVVDTVSGAVQGKQNRKFQREMWDKTNAYNTPLAQRQRMELAGFNPNMMYGHGSVANTASNQQLPQQEPMKIGDNVLRALGGYQDLRNKRTDMKLQEQNIVNAEHQGRLLSAQTFKANMEGLDKWNNLPEDAKKSGLANKLTQAGIVGQEARTKGILQDIEKSKQDVKESEQRITESGQRITESKGRVSLQPLQKKSIALSNARKAVENKYITPRNEATIANILERTRSSNLYNAGKVISNSWLQEEKKIQVLQAMKNYDTSTWTQRTAKANAEIREFENDMKALAFTTSEINKLVNMFTSVKSKK